MNYKQELSQLKRDILEGRKKDTAESLETIKNIFHSITEINCDTELLEFVQSLRTPQTSRKMATLTEKYRCGRVISVKDKVQIMDWILTRLFTIAKIEI